MTDSVSSFVWGSEFRGDPGASARTPPAAALLGPAGWVATSRLGGTQVLADADAVWGGDLRPFIEA